MALPRLSLMQGILVRAELAARLEEAASKGATAATAPAADLAELHARIAKLEARREELTVAPGDVPSVPAAANDITAPESEFVDTREAAALLGISPRTLEGLRARGAGPAHVRIGRAVRYARAELRRAAK